jgi:Uma2 family endonuclease
MATAATTAESVTTVGDLLADLGGVSPRRVRLQPWPGTATEADVARIHAGEKRLFELVDGVLVEKPMGYMESHLAGVLIKLLGVFLDRHDLGIVAGESGMLRLGRGLVRIPDVSFVSWSKLPGKRVPREPIPSLVPDLAVEVLSPTNTSREMARKLDEYFAAGVRLVWLIDPAAKTVRVYESRDAHVVLGVRDSLSGGSVLPGFRLPLRKLFASLGR